jgi:hypothetical protein
MGQSGQKNISTGFCLIWNVSVRWLKKGREAIALLKLASALPCFGCFPIGVAEHQILL